MSSKLKELVDKLAEAGVVSFYVQAYGSGDEGQWEDPDITFGEGAASGDTDLDIDELLDEVLEERGFNYSDGAGGDLNLSIDVTTRTCSWSAFVNSTVECEEASGEENV